MLLITHSAISCSIISKVVISMRGTNIAEDSQKCWKRTNCNHIWIEIMVKPRNTAWKNGFGPVHRCKTSWSSWKDFKGWEMGATRTDWETEVERKSHLKWFCSIGLKESLICTELFLLMKSWYTMKTQREKDHIGPGRKAQSTAGRNYLERNQCSDFCISLVLSGLSF